MTVVTFPLSTDFYSGMEGVMLVGQFALDKTTLALLISSSYWYKHVCPCISYKLDSKLSVVEFFSSYFLLFC